MYSLTVSLSKKFSRGFGSVFYRPNKNKKKDAESEEVEKHVTRKKPVGLDDLCHSTKFTRKELQIMYRGFKNECPSGSVNEETFKYIYSQFFPQGDCSSYAHYVFNTFDLDHSGTISFEEFVMGLSLLLRGSLLEKLQWMFSLYDVNQDGVITIEEMLQVAKSIYDVMGRFCEPKTDPESVQIHVNEIFQKLDADGDGVISFDEFIETCRKDKRITDAVSVFETVF